MCTGFVHTLVSLVKQTCYDDNPFAWDATSGVHPGSQPRGVYTALVFSNDCVPVPLCSMWMMLQY